MATLSPRYGPLASVAPWRKPPLGSERLAMIQCGGAQRVVENRLVAGGGVERDEAVDGPAVFAGVNVFVDARDALGAAMRVIEREIIGAVLAFDDVGVLAGVEGALWRGEKRFEEVANFLRGVQIFRILKLGVGQRVDAQIFGLHLHDFFEVRGVPVAVGGVLVDAAPGGIEQVQLLIERLASHVFGLFVLVAAGENHGVFDGIPIQKFLVGAPAAEFGIVAGEIICRELGAQRRGEDRVRGNR